MPKFQLFRAKVIRGLQMPLLDSGRTSSDLINEAIRAKPSAELRTGHTWHIGNVADVETNGIYFACGRTTTATVERYDASLGNFVEEEYDSAPYTHVMFDSTTQVAAISAKSRLAPTIPGIARQVQRLLNASRVAREHEVTFELAEIKDPEDFIGHLRSAYSISRFTFLFSRPNPIDVNADFVAPLEKFLHESRGSRGQAGVTGDSLDPRVLEDVARSAATSGDDAEATIRTSEAARSIKKRLRGNPVTITEDDPDDHDKKQALLARIRDLYDRLRERIG